MKLDRLPWLQIAQQVGKEPALHPIHTKIKLIGARSRSNRIGPRLHLAILVFRYTGDELPRSEGKILQLVNFELKVIALRGVREQKFLLKACGVKLSCQSLVSLP